MESEDWKSILYNCLKNWDRKVNDIYNLGKCTQQSQVKGDFLISERKQTTEFLSAKFDELEKDRIKKEETISKPQNEVSVLNDKVASLEKEAWKTWWWSGAVLLEELPPEQWNGWTTRRVYRW